MINRMTILPDSGLVMIDGRGFNGLDMSSLPSNIHAVQWYGEHGELEYQSDGVAEKPANTIFHSLDAFHMVIAEWEAAREAEDNPPPAPPPSLEEISAMLLRYVDAHLDATARERNYDSTLTICTYGDTGNARFDAEALAFKRWRSLVWERCYELQAEVLAGHRAVPTEKELIALLPQMEWPS